MINWGVKITIVYSGFVVLITSMVLISSSHKVDLVAKDYYEQELNYQQKIDALTREKQLKETIDYRLTASGILLHASPTGISANFKGEVLFFRPSDPSMDVKQKLCFDSEGDQLIPKTALHKGVYKMCLSWENNSVTYYKESIITI